jgi:xanthine dehydrogenase accessory factor
VIDIYSKIEELRKAGECFAVCTVVGTKGSTPRKIGAKMIVNDKGDIFGTIGGGELERKVIEDALAGFRGGEPKVFRHDLLHQHGMCCGGTVDIFIEPVMTKRKLYIFGAGHTGQNLAKMAVNFDFEIVLIDDRKEYLRGFNVLSVNKMPLPFDEALKLLPFDEQTYVCIMTYSHQVDRNILAYCLRKPFAYLGMIGSQRKVAMTRKMFSEGLNISQDELGKVDMPMGIDIGAESPEEIALSILGKLIIVKNKLNVWEKELQL